MAKIEKSDVEKITKLSRLELTDTEKSKFTDQFSEILGYVEKLNATDTSKVSEVDQISGLKNIIREDKVAESLSQEEALVNAPNKQDGFIKVKSILK